MPPPSRPASGIHLYTPLFRPHIITTWRLISRPIQLCACAPNGLARLVWDRAGRLARRANPGPRFGWLNLLCPRAQCTALLTMPSRGSYPRAQS
jgi:hypothetical protein